MPAKKTHNLAAAVSEYTGRNGKTYKNWENVGHLVKYDDGGYEIFLKSWQNLALLPKTPEGYVRARLFPVLERGEKLGQTDHSADAFAPADNGGKINPEAWDPDKRECPF